MDSVAAFAILGASMDSIECETVDGTVLVTEFEVFTPAKVAWLAVGKRSGGALSKGVVVRVVSADEASSVGGSAVLLVSVVVGVRCTIPRLPSLVGAGIVAKGTVVIWGI